ncbi:MAG: hypothetical protein GEV08_10590 [Acidimicrobiia bacterium]|nr:hypothetical protein [Acidimicrobiia bacterium]
MGEEGAASTEANGDALSSPGVMSGEGYYAHHSITQHGAAALGLPLVGPCVDGLVLPPGDGPLTMGDLGAAQGGNSLAAFAAALDALGRRAPGRPVLVVHSDLPTNDFATLFDVVETSPDSYLRGRSGVFPLVAGRVLYQRIFPAGQLAFGWTASTLHWLSSPPCPVEGHFFAQLSHDEAAKRAYAARSRQDWADFLACRAVELAPGAGVVLVDVAMDEDGLMGSEALFDALNDALRAVHAAGVLDDDELARLVYPTWFRSVEELSAPFRPYAVGPGGERLDLVDVTPTRLGDPFRAAFERDGDAGAYAQAQVGFLRGFLQPSFAAVLDRRRAPGERDRVLASVWQEAATRIAAGPSRCFADYRLVTARVRRLAEDDPTTRGGDG